MMEYNRANRCIHRVVTLLLLFGGLVLVVGIGGCDLLVGGLVPATPTDLTATDGSFADRVRLTWSPVPEAGGYEVWKATTSGGTYAFLGATAHPFYDDMAALPDTTYWYKVRACNRAGCSEFTPPRAGKAVSNLVPAVPGGLAASQGTFTDRVEVTWQAAPRATGYNVYRATASAGPYTMVAAVTGTTYGDTDIALGTTYWYKVRACSSAGCSVLSESVSGYAASQVPAAPQGVTASDGTEAGKVVVTWQAATGATNYLVYRATAADAPPSLVTGVTETTYADTAVQSGTTYWYWIRACNNSGCSPLSNPDSGSPGTNGEEPPPPPPPTSL